MVKAASSVARSVAERREHRVATLVVAAVEKRGEVDVAGRDWGFVER
jgi:hypothetical protein